MARYIRQALPAGAAFAGTPGVALAVDPACIAPYRAGLAAGTVRPAR